MPSIRSKAGGPRAPTEERRYGSSRPRRRLRLPSRRLIALLLAIAVAAWAAVYWTTREDLRAGSVVVPSSPDDKPLPITRTLQSYRIDYRVEDRARETVISTDRIWISRPFDGRIESWTGPPPGDKLLSTRVSNFSRFGTRNEGSDGSIVQTIPALATSDVRFDALLASMADSNEILVRERRRVAGRACQVYRVGGPVNAGDLKPFDPEAQEYADICVDEAGLLLEELWVLNGDTLRRRIAHTVVENPDLSREVFQMPEGKEIDPKSGGGSVRLLVPTTRPPGDEFWEISPPEGMTHRGRYAVVPAAPRDENDPEARQRMMASVTDVFVDGPDVLIVEVGGTLGNIDVYKPDSRGTSVELGEIGKGQLIRGLRQDEVRVLQGKGRFVRVTGTVGSDRLVEVAKTLHKVPAGTELECMSDAGVPEPCVSPKPPPSPRPEGEAGHGHDDHAEDDHT